MMYAPGFDQTHNHSSDIVKLAYPNALSVRRKGKYYIKASRNSNCYLSNGKSSSDAAWNEVAKKIKPKTIG